MTKDQESGLVELADKSAEKLSNFYDGLAVAINAMLISPDFLFVIDRYEADPDHAGQRPPRRLLLRNTPQPVAVEFGPRR